jgi:hypothetical protein
METRRSFSGLRIPGFCPEAGNCSDCLSLLCVQVVIYE